jgi:tRNA-modifying protein YgfZ
LELIEMRDARIALLPDRGVVSVTGEDARKLLSGIITNDIDLLDSQPAIFAGLLSPQGKILFEFFIAKTENGLLLDVISDKAGELVKRLVMYKLRAKAGIVDESADMAVVAGLGSELGARTVGFDDPRAPGLGPRCILLDARAWGGPAMIAADRGWSPPAAYHAHRIALGIPEGGKDYDFGDAFPHEANFDLNHGVSFEKGCYVGQEIVARMQHRGTVRKRIVRVLATVDLPTSRPDVSMGDVVIGRLGSVAGKMGLVTLRLDRAIEAIDQGQAITAGGIALEVDKEMIARQRSLMAAKAGTP